MVDDRLLFGFTLQSKGLEWTSVIIVRANEGVLPIVDIEASRVKDAEHPHPQSESPKVRESSVSHSGTGPTEVARACLSPSEEELEEEVSTDNKATDELCETDAKCSLPET